VVGVEEFLLGNRHLRIDSHSLSRAQELRQLLAVGYLRFDSEQVGDEIHDRHRYRNPQQAEHNQDDATALPLVSSNFIHIESFGFLVRWLIPT
jgi:hypothetical protein